MLFIIEVSLTAQYCGKGNRLGEMIQWVAHRLPIFLDVNHNVALCSLIGMSNLIFSHHRMALCMTAPSLHQESGHYEESRVEMMVAI